MVINGLNALTTTVLVMTASGTCIRRSNDAITLCTRYNIKQSAVTVFMAIQILDDTSPHAFYY